MVKTLEEEFEKSRLSNEELTNSLNESYSKKIEIANENVKLIEQNVFLKNENSNLKESISRFNKEKENDNLKESISRFNKGKEIFDGMIPMTSTPLKSKNGIGFKNAHVSSSKNANPNTQITKVYQKPSLKTNGPKKSNENKTKKSRANSSRGPKHRKYNHAHSHGFYNFKMKEHVKNFR